MKVISIDPGYEKVGYAIVEKKERTTIIRTSGLITTSRKDSPSRRLLHIYTALHAVITSNNPDQLVIEKIFFFKNQKTIIGVSQASGVISLLAEQMKLQIHELTPLQIKLAITGDGRADKKAVVKMLQLELGTELHVKDDDESDAIACAMAFFMLGLQKP